MFLALGSSFTWLYRVVKTETIYANTTRMELYENP